MNRKKGLFLAKIFVKEYGLGNVGKLEENTEILVNKMKQKILRAFDLIGKGKKDNFSFF